MKIDYINNKLKYKGDEYIAERKKSILIIAFVALLVLGAEEYFNNHEETKMDQSEDSPIYYEDPNDMDADGIEDTKDNHVTDNQIEIIGQQVAKKDRENKDPIQAVEEVLNNHFSDQGDVTYNRILNSFILNYDPESSIYLQFKLDSVDSNEWNNNVDSYLLASRYIYTKLGSNYKLTVRSPITELDDIIFSALDGEITYNYMDSSVEEE